MTNPFYHRGFTVTILPAGSQFNISIKEPSAGKLIEISEKHQGDITVSRKVATDYIDEVLVNEK